MPQDDQKYIIFVHGFLGSAENFEELAEQMAERGYHVVANEYSSFDGGVAELARQVIPQSLEDAKEAKEINFVTHSMGALLLRSYLAEFKVDNLKRVVMIAPPNHGSEVADRMSEYEWWVEMFGQAGMDLRTNVIFPLMPESVEFGVIAGSASWNFLSKDWIPCDDDGWVGLASTKLDGMKDYVEVNSSHGLVTANKSVIEQTAYFLNNGNFASNIEMVGSKVNVNSIEDINERATQIASGMNRWYKKLFKDGDEETIEVARSELSDQVGDFNSWFDRWRSRNVDS